MSWVMRLPKAFHDRHPSGGVFAKPENERAQLTAGFRRDGEGCGAPFHPGGKSLERAGGSKLVAGGGAGGCTWRVLMGLPRNEAALKVLLGSPLNAMMSSKGKIIETRKTRPRLGSAAPGAVVKRANRARFPGEEAFRRSGDGNGAGVVGAGGRRAAGETGRAAEARGCDGSKAEQMAAAAAAVRRAEEVVAEAQLVVRGVVERRSGGGRSAERDLTRRTGKGAETGMPSGRPPGE